MDIMIKEMNKDLSHIDFQTDSASTNGLPTREISRPRLKLDQTGFTQREFLATGSVENPMNTQTAFPSIITRTNF